MTGTVRRAGAVAALVGAALLAPVRMAEGAPKTRFAVLGARVQADPAPAGRNGETAVLPAIPPPAGPALSSPFPLSHVGLRWRGSEDAAVDVRFGDDDGLFGPWRAMPADHDLDDEDGGPVLSTLIRAHGATRVQARAAGDVSGLEIVAIDTVAGPRERHLAVVHPARAAEAPPPEPDGSEDRTPPRSADASATTTTAGKEPKPAVAQPAVTTRAQWGADESLRKGEPKFAPIVKLFVHHTVTAPDGPDSDPAATIRAIYAYHTQANGWDDIGYNFLVDARGRIYEGRRARDYAPGEIPTGEDPQGYGVVGAHVSGHNFGSAAVAMIGDFTGGEPTAAALDSLQRMMAWKADRHDIDVRGSDPFTTTDGTTEVFANLAGHRDAGRTACPGDALYPLLPRIRDGVAQVVTIANAPNKGYWTATADGRVLPFGEAQPSGSLAGKALNGSIVGMAATSSGGGYWLLGSDGGIFAFGDARFHGSTGSMKLNKPIMRMAATPTGKGYWLVASDGGIFAFGDAAFYGSTGSMKLNKPVVGMASTPTGKGYWLVASDGGIFSYGDAVFHGSTGSLQLAQPVVSMAPTANGLGYWLVARDGGVFAFDAPFYGSIPQLKPESYPGAVQLRATNTGRGYYIADSAGGVVNLGDARFYGSDGSQRPPGVAVDLALAP